MGGARPAAGDFLPLTPAAFRVLTVLADGDAHGYAILKAVRDEHGTGSLSTGTLYGILSRLLADGLIAERGGRPGDAERRRAYRLTPLGRDVARAELARLEQAVSAARATALLRRPQKA